MLILNNYRKFKFSKRKVNNEQSTLHTKHNLKQPPPPTCGAFVSPPDKVIHYMILGCKTDMMGLMLAFQFTMPFSITQGQNFPRFPYNLAQHLSSK
jgi:hypothetical protein